MTFRDWLDLEETPNGVVLCLLALLLIFLFDMLFVGVTPQFKLISLITIEQKPQLNLSSTFGYMKQNGCGGIYIWHNYTANEDYLVCQKQTCIDGYCKYTYERID